MTPIPSAPDSEDPFERRRARGTDIPKLQLRAGSEPERFQWRIDVNNPVRVVAMIYGEPDVLDVQMMVCRSKAVARLVVTQHNTVWKTAEAKWMEGA